MVKKKYKSKRSTLKDKYKIQRRVVDHHRKQRKEAKRNAKAGKMTDYNKKKNRDPGIPNSWPFKHDLLKEIERAREKAEINRKERRSKQKENNERKDENEMMMEESEETNLIELAKTVKESQAQFNAKQSIKNTDGNNNNIADHSSSSSSSASSLAGQSSRRAYFRELRKVIDASDVILQVLDARDPSGTRISRSVEDAILSNHDRRMVLVLNKIDLVPKDAVAGWLTYLRRSHPTLAMKAGTNRSMGDVIGRTKGESALQSTSGVGVDVLLHLLKNYARCSSSSSDGASKACISVGIIGYPNVGKSSILNTLKRSRAVGTSPRPGFTTSMQEVVLDKSVRLIDSPGVVFDDDGDNNGVSALLRNSINVDSIQDPIPAVQTLLRRCSVQTLMMTYNIPAFPRDDVMIFLALVGKRSGRVLKGGIPDKVRAARNVLRDWNSGKIAYFTPPPTTSSSPDVAEDDARIVSEFGKEFNASSAIVEHDAKVLEGLMNDGMDFVALEQQQQQHDDDSNTKETTKLAAFLAGDGGEEEEEDNAMEEE